MNVIRGLLFDNLGLKLVALLLAVLVYLNVKLDRPATMVITFPLAIEDLPDSLSLYGPAPGGVQVELRGTGKQLLALRVKEPPLKISLVDVQPGRFERRLSDSDLPFPAGQGIEVDRLIGPQLIQLEIDRKRTRRIPARARVEGTPGGGARWTGTVFLRPPEVEVTGPARALAGLDSLVLEPVRIDGRRDTVRVLVSPQSLPDWCVADPAGVTVVVPLTHARP